MAFRAFHWRPVRSTNKLAYLASRSGTRGLWERSLIRMHVVIVDEELPYPLNSGKRIRTFQLVSRLAVRHRITYICHRNADADEAVDSKSHGIISSVSRNRRSFTYSMRHWNPLSKEFALCRP